MLRKERRMPIKLSFQTQPSQIQLNSNLVWLSVMILFWACSYLHLVSWSILSYLSLCCESNLCSLSIFVLAKILKVIKGDNFLVWWTFEFLINVCTYCFGNVYCKQFYWRPIAITSTNDIKVHQKRLCCLKSNC